MALPQKLGLPQMQTTWAQAIDPVLVNPIVNGLILKKIQLIAGTNAVNHLLGRPLQGWYVTRMRGVSANLYDIQDSNQTPQLTLALFSSDAVTIDLAVF